MVQYTEYSTRYFITAHCNSVPLHCLSKTEDKHCNGLRQALILAPSSCCHLKMLTQLTQHNVPVNNLHKEPGPHGVDGLAGVGLFFQQSPQEGIFVASVTPGCAAARTACIKKGDLVIKVNEDPVQGISLAQLRQFVLGPPGSFVVFTFRRRTSDSTYFCYDVDLMRGTGEFLDLVERNVQQTLLKEDLEIQLTRTERSCSAMEADIQALVNHPVMQVEDKRTSELAHELKCRMEDLRRLQATQIRVEERCRELEKRKLETQQRLERERSERLKGPHTHTTPATHIQVPLWLFLSPSFALLLIRFLQARSCCGTAMNRLQTHKGDTQRSRRLPCPCWRSCITTSSWSLTSGSSPRRHFQTLWRRFTT